MIHKENEKESIVVYVGVASRYSAAYNLKNVREIQIDLNAEHDKINACGQSRKSQQKISSILVHAVNEPGNDFKSPARGCGYCKSSAFFFFLCRYFALTKLTVYLLYKKNAITYLLQEHALLIKKTLSIAFLLQLLTVNVIKYLDPLVVHNFEISKSIPDSTKSIIVLL